MFHLDCSLGHLVIIFMCLPTRHAQMLRPITPEMVTYECEELTTLDLCTHIYSHASFPNYRGHPDQVTANLELLNFTPLIESVCSNAIVHFLCSIYAPFCLVGQENVRIMPCRELCTHVRSTCEPPLREFNLDWPPHLVCDNFSPDNTTALDFCPDNIPALPFPENVATIPPFQTAEPPNTTPAEPWNTTSDSEPVTDITQDATMSPQPPNAASEHPSATVEAGKSASSQFPQLSTIITSTLALVSVCLFSC